MHLYIYDFFCQPVPTLEVCWVPWFRTFALERSSTVHRKKKSTQCLFLISKWFWKLLSMQIIQGNLKNVWPLLKTDVVQGAMQQVLANWKVVNLTPRDTDNNCLQICYIKVTGNASLSAIPAHTHTRTLVVLVFLLALLHPHFFPLAFSLALSGLIDVFFFCVHRQQGVLYLQGRHTGIRSHPHIHFHTHVHTG